ncbi:MAG: DNA polymerase III subunit delta [Candidatus Gracilibacteria bacterium]|jgi:DNA polymerase-3 subunit delta
MESPNLYLMSGEDHFSMRQELTRWKDAFVSKFGESDWEELDGSNTSVEQIISSISTRPFLSEKRLVVLKNFLGSQKAETANTLLPALEKLPESTVLVMVEESKPDERTSIFKRLNILATKRLFLKPKGVQLSTWVQRRAEQAGARINPETASYLVSAVGDDLFALDQEIQKLTLYARGEPILREMVDELVTGIVQKSIFTLTDQLAQKNFAGVLKTMEDLKAQGEDPAFIFSMIVRQIRLILEMKALSEQNLPAPMMARKMGVHPFVVSSSLRFTKNFTFEQLRYFLKKFMELDHRLKTGLIPLKPREEDQYLLAIERILLRA